MKKFVLSLVLAASVVCCLAVPSLASAKQRCQFGDNGIVKAYHLDVSCSTAKSVFHHLLDSGLSLKPNTGGPGVRFRVNGRVWGAYEGYATKRRAQIYFWRGNRDFWVQVPAWVAQGG